LASLLARLQRVDADETRLPTSEQLAHDLGLFAPELGASWLQGQRKRSACEEILGELAACWPDCVPCAASPWRYPWLP
jgi:hypothetical protein